METFENHSLRIEFFNQLIKGVNVFYCVCGFVLFHEFTGNGCFNIESVVYYYIKVERSKSYLLKKYAHIDFKSTKIFNDVICHQDNHKILIVYIWF